MENTISYWFDRPKTNNELQLEGGQYKDGMRQPQEHFRATNKNPAVKRRIFIIVINNYNSREMLNVVPV